MLLVRNKECVTTEFEVNLERQLKHQGKESQSRLRVLSFEMSRTKPANENAGQAVE